MTLVHTARKMLWPLGIDLQRFDPLTNYMARRKMLFKQYEVDTVLDVGANTGQYIYDLRSNFGFTGSAISFEPLREAFQVLQKNSGQDPKWKAFNYALGDKDGATEINVSGNSQSSSLLGMNETHIQSAPDSRYVSVESISVKRLDSVFDTVCSDAKNIYMKLDTQGYESFVLDGAKQSLPKIQTVQMELSVVTLYNGQVLLPEMLNTMTKLGYSLVAIEPGFYSPGGKILQIDGIFHRYE